MAHHASSKKRIRQDAIKRLRNRYNKKTARNLIRKLRGTTDRAAATAMLPGVISLVDKLAKRNTWHKNKASNLKSKLTRHVAKIA